MMKHIVTRMAETGDAESGPMGVHIVFARPFDSEAEAKEWVAKQLHPTWYSVEYGEWDEPEDVPAMGYTFEPCCMWHGDGGDGEACKDVEFFPE